jgi:hypothetical protein
MHAAAALAHSVLAALINMFNNALYCNHDDDATGG